MISRRNLSVTLISDLVARHVDLMSCLTDMESWTIDHLLIKQEMSSIVNCKAQRRAGGSDEGVKD